MPGPSFEEINAKADELQTALDAEQLEVQKLLSEKDETITTLGDVITDLKAQVADGGTTEQRQALLDKLVTFKADLESTVTPAQESISGDVSEEGFPG